MTTIEDLIRHLEAEHQRHKANAMEAASAGLGSCANADERVAMAYHTAAHWAKAVKWEMEQEKKGKVAA